MQPTSQIPSSNSTQNSLRIKKAHRLEFSFLKQYVLNVLLILFSVMLIQRSFYYNLTLTIKISFSKYTFSKLRGVVKIFYGKSGPLTKRVALYQHVPT